MVRWCSQEAGAVRGPDALARGVGGDGQRERAAAFEVGGERIARRLGHGGRSCGRLRLAEAFDRARDYRERYKRARADAHPDHGIEPHRSVVEHRDRSRLIAAAGRDEAGELLARLVLARRRLRAFEALRAALRGEQRGQVGELLRLEREQLVARLRRLQRAGRALARAHQRADLRLRRRQVADHGRLRFQRVLEAAQRIAPARLRVGDELRRRRRPGVAIGIDVLELALDVGDVVEHALRLAEQRLRALDRREQFAESRIRQRREIARLVDQPLRLVLQRGDLVVDLLQRARGGQHILAEVRRVEHGDARAGGRGRDRG